MQPFPLEDIRQAVAAEEYERAQHLWSQCAAEVGQELNLGSLTEARLVEIRELVEWSRSVVLCARSHMLDQLNSLHIAGEYEPPAPPPAHISEARF